MKTGREWMLGVLLASLIAVAALSFGLIFYRKKYIKEKDPSLPTLTYVFIYTYINLNFICLY